MKALITLIIGLIFSVCAVFSQNATIDSLKKVIETTKVDTTKAKSLCWLCRYLVKEGDLKNAGQKVEEGLALAEKTMDKKGIAFCIGAKVNMCLYTGDFPQALVLSQKCLQLKEQIGEPKGIAMAIMNIGVAYASQGNSDEAITYYLKALKMQEKIGAKKDIALTLGNIAGTYSRLGNNEKTLEYSLKAFEVLKQLGDKRSLYSAFNLLGSIYKKKGNYVLALENYQKALPLLQQYADKNGVGQCYSNLAFLYLKFNNPKLAREYAQKGYELTLENKHLDYIKNSLEILCQTDSAVGDFKVAYEHHKLFKQYADSLRNEDKAQEFGRLESKFQYDKELEQRRKQEAEKEIRRQLYYYLFGGIFTLVLMLTGFIYYRYQSKNKANRQLSEKNNLISAQKVEIENAYEELNTILDQIQMQKVMIENANEELNATLEQVQSQKEEIRQKNEKIEDSLHYAYQIQTAILPDPAYLSTLLPNHFIFYQPKDIVSGDFYWVTEREDLIFFCVADCTGHGVPGAFMSVVSSNALHSAVNELGLIEPEAILHEADRKIRHTLHQEQGSDSKDGMDLALCVWDRRNSSLRYAGAGRPLYHFSSDTLTEIKGDKFPIGGGQYENKIFTSHNLTLQKGDRLYLFTDGITDQFGGTTKKKFTPKRLQEFIIQQRSLGIEEQGIAYRKMMKDWMQNHVQLDDLTLLAVEVPKIS